MQDNTSNNAGQSVDKQDSLQKTGTFSALPQTKSPRSTSRLNKSTSWFNSLSRRASRITPSKKRSFGTIFSDSNLDHAKPRLNKSDWDLRKPAIQVTVNHPSASSKMSSPASSHYLRPSSSKSTDFLDSTVSGTRFDVTEPESSVSLYDTSRHCSCEVAEVGLAVPRDCELCRDKIKISENSKSKSTDFCSFGSNTDILNMSADEIPSLGQAQPNVYYTIDSRRLASKHKKSQRDRKLLYGVKQFNLEPKRGLEYLHDSGFVDCESAESVATFLFRQERLSKKQVGAYLGSHKEFNKTVLSIFVKCHEFTKLLLVQALRQFLWSFRLPGEAMQIDRIMDSFSSHYCAQNPNLFEETDTCFILSFSIIMLNTALHNPNAKMKITSEQFVKQNKGINSGRDLPADMLDAIFKNIKEEPFKIPDETYDDLMYTFFSPEREGWLLKQGGSWKTWKRRWFVLNDRCLYYFQHTAENVPKGIIPLENVRVRQCEDKYGKEFCFEIYSESAEIIKGCKTDSGGTVVQGNHKQYRMNASSEEDRDCWIQCIQESIREHPFYKIISDKKAAIRRRSGTRPTSTNTS